jgi:peptidoglycan/LPS O-acetylase OafA/YrhL
VEEHFYLCFPLLAWWLARSGSAKAFAAACLFLLFGGMALRAWLWLHMGDRPFVEVIYYPTWNRLDGLLAGVVLAAAQVYRPALWAWVQAKANVLLLAGLAMTGAAIAMFQDRIGLPATVIGYPLLSWGLALVVAAGASPAGLLGRRVPGAGWLALVSYSLYLSHKLAFHAVQGWLAAHPQVQGLAAFALYAAGTLAVGALLHYTVEAPFLRLRDRLQRRRETGVALAPTSAGA